MWQFVDKKLSACVARVSREQEVKRLVWKRRFSYYFSRRSIRFRKCFIEIINVASIGTVFYVTSCKVECSYSTHPAVVRSWFVSLWYRVKYTVIMLSCTRCSMKTDGNFINECGTRVPWFSENARSLSLESRVDKAIFSSNSLIQIQLTYSTSKCFTLLSC